MPINALKPRIEKDLEASLGRFGTGRLADACAYSLRNGGKRFRPALVHLVAQSIGSEDVTHPALAVEFFHTASLIADDLPCMDDDDIRRGQPALHIAFDEATALLTTYALIAEGYEQIRLGAANPDQLNCALQNATKNTGALGVTGGQYLDLHPGKASIEKVLEMKTATLFELSFVFGWIFGGGDVKLLDSVIELSLHFGLAFQIRDDLLDYQEDEGRTNLAISKGVDVAKRRFDEELALFSKKSRKLNLTKLLQVLSV